LVLFAIAFFSCRTSSGQTLFWADTLDYEYNSFGVEKWSGKQALGPPNAPIGTLSEDAYRINKESEFGTVVVQFKSPKKAKRVVIIESNLPGRVTEVDIIDVNNNRYTAFRGLPLEINQYDNRALVIPLLRSGVAIKMISVNVNTIPLPGWAQIDAIGLTDAEDFETAEQLILEYGPYYVEEVLPFVAEREHLGENINTPADENKPIISPDGKTLYFTRAFYPENVRGVKDELDIWYSTQRSNAWKLAENIGAPLNDKKPNGVSSVSPDGNTLLLINTYRRRGTITSRTSISNRTKDGWSTPEMQVIDDYYNYSPFEDYFLASNGQILITAMERSDTYGELDLYICFKEDNGDWSVPINLGPDINTPSQDFSPFLAPDSKTLFFASEGHGGYGRSDIFFIRRLDDSWLSWSKPVNIGSSVNTSGMDAYYSVSAQGDFAYFASTNGGIENSRDIFRIELPEEFKPEAVLLVKGKVVDQAQSEPISARIYFSSIGDEFDEGSAITNPATGEFSIVLTSGKQYSFHAEAPGFISVDEFVDLTDISEYEEVQKDLSMKKIQVGEVVPLNNVFFQKDVASLQSESFIGLERFVNFMNDNPSMTLEVQVASRSDVEGLGMMRAEAIKEYMVNRGIKEKRIQLSGVKGPRNTVEVKILSI